MSPRGSLGSVVRLLLLVALALCVVIDAALAADRLINIPRRDGSPVPARLYGDWNDEGCPPTVLVSHGLGGSEDGLRYLGEGLAASGYRVAVIGHRESGRRALIEVMAAREKEPLIADPRKFEGRFMDLDAALSYAVRDCRPALLVLAGHSMGAATVMVEAGATGKVATGAADRFDAYVAISPQGVGWMFDHGAWRNISKPVLMVTGTRDSGYDDDYETRLAAFEGLLPSRKRLAVIPEATHLNLGGVGNKPVQATVLLVVKEFLLQTATGAPAPSGVTEARIVDK